MPRQLTKWAGNFRKFCLEWSQPLADNLTLASLTTWPGRVLYVPLFPLQHLFLINFDRFAATYFCLKKGGSKQRTRSLLDNPRALQDLIIPPLQLTPHCNQKHRAKPIKESSYNPA